MAEGIRSFLGAWEEYRVEADEYRELDDERVLVVHHVSGRGKTSGLDLGQRRAKTANLFHVRGGKVTELVLYFAGVRPVVAAERLISAAGETLGSSAAKPYGSSPLGTTRITRVTVKVFGGGRPGDRGVRSLSRGFSVSVPSRASLSEEAREERR
jgi:hypothetical protein